MSKRTRTPIKHFDSVSLKVSPSQWNQLADRYETLLLAQEAEELASWEPRDDDHDDNDEV